VTKPESRLQRQVEKYLKSVGVIYTNCSGIGDGVSDLIVLCRGRYIELELKTPKGTHDLLQRIREKLIKQQRGEYYTPRSLEEVRQIIGE
jgi:hypothetical protein